MENAGSKDLFVFFELLVWAIKEGNLDFIQEQIDKSFPNIVDDCLKNQRTLDRFLAFFTPSTIEIVQKYFENLNNQSQEEGF